MRFNPKSETLKVFLAEITPAEADQILQQYNTNNYRSLRDHVAGRYASDIKKKDWEPGVSTVDFDTTPILINGQHTLEACRTSNKPITVTVRTGFPERVREVIDSGLSRRITDVLSASPLYVGIGSILFNSFQGKVPSQRLTDGRVQLIDFIRKHEAAINFAVSLVQLDRGSRRGIRTSPVLAVAARAFYTEDKEKVSSFYKILGSGVTSGFKYEETVIKHRDWLLSESMNGDRRKAAYYRTTKALRAYLDGIFAPKIMAVECGEMFLLPGEKVRKEKA